jgi:hypothetical protein
VGPAAVGVSESVRFVGESRGEGRLGSLNCYSLSMIPWA